MGKSGSFAGLFYPVDHHPNDFGQMDFKGKIRLRNLTYLDH